MMLHRSMLVWRGHPSAIGICAFFYRWNLLGVMVLHRSMLIWRAIHLQGYMCILLYVKLIGCNSVAEMYGHLEEGVGSVCHRYMCILLYLKLGVMMLHRSMLVWKGASICHRYRWNLWGVTVLQRCMVIWRRGGSVCHRYMCILLYLKLGVMMLHRSMLVWRGHPSAIGICAFFYMWNLLGVMVLHRSLLIGRRGWVQSSIGICAFSSLCETYWGICAFFYRWNLLGVMVLHRSLLIWRSIHLQGYMCILLYVKLMRCNGVAEIYGQLEGGPSAMGICAFFSMWNLLGVMALYRSMLIWGQSAIGICALFYMLNLLPVMMLHRSMLDWRRGEVSLP